MTSQKNVYMGGYSATSCDILPSLRSIRNSHTSLLGITNKLTQVSLSIVFFGYWLRYGLVKSPFGHPSCKSVCASWDFQTCDDLRLRLARDLWLRSFQPT